jgi:transcriptional regulator with PAS, ATPase and Fis domain
MKSDFKNRHLTKEVDFSFEQKSDQVAEQIEKSIITEILEEEAYIITDSAEKLQIDQQFLLKKMKQYEL